MGQDLGLPAPPSPGSYNPVGQAMGRYQEGTAPMIGPDPKAKAAPSVPGADLAGLSGLPQTPAQPPDPNTLKTIIAQLLSRQRR
jgi:hypothetical protein